MAQINHDNLQIFLQHTNARKHMKASTLPYSQRLAGPHTLTSVIIAKLHTTVCFGECGGLHLSLRVKWEMLVYNF